MPEKILDIRAAGRDWSLLTGDMEELWQEMVEENNRHQHSQQHTDHMTSHLQELWDDDERLPYWAELWPSSLALAQWLEEHQPLIQNAACLDMGCGLGFTALVGAHLGARVLGMDYDEQALRYAARNTLRNPVSSLSPDDPAFPVHWTCMDWRVPTLEAHSMDYIWAGDIMYEQPFARPIASFISYSLARSGVAWIAEPGRTVFEHLLRECALHGLIARKIEKRDIWPLQPQKVPVPVNIWEIRPDPFKAG